MPTLNEGLRRVFTELAEERKGEGVINLMTAVDKDGFEYKLQLRPICPKCGGELHPTEHNTYLFCRETGCLYGREVGGI